MMTRVTLTAIASGVLLGLGAAVPIGPVNVEIARRTLRGGFAAGVALGCGAVTVDITYAVLSSLSLRPLLDQHWLMLTLSIAGTVLLVYLGVMSLRAAWKSRKLDATTLFAAPALSLHGGYVTGLLMTLLNPITLAFWFLVVPATTLKLGLDPSHDLPAICTGVFLGTISWVMTFAGLLTWLGRSKKPTWIILADAIGGAVLLAFAAAAIWRTIG